MVTLSPSTPKVYPPLDPRRKRVLVAEDEDEIRQLIVLHLHREGFVVDEVQDGEKARQALLTNSYNLVILDWMMPVLSGLEVTRWARRQPDLATVPILFVTAKTDPEFIATGLDAGADDYLTKPFDTVVLRARVNALLRRQEWLYGQADEPETESALLILGPLILNTESYESTVDNVPLELTRSEFRLLESLLLKQGKVCSRESLIEEIQGEGVNVVGRTVDTHVFGLRKKLGAYSDIIETIRGVGYRVRYLPEK